MKPTAPPPITRDAGCPACRFYARFEDFHGQPVTRCYALPEIVVNRNSVVACSLWERKDPPPAKRD